MADFGDIAKTAVGWGLGVITFLIAHARNARSYLTRYKPHLYIQADHENPRHIVNLGRGVAWNILGQEDLADDGRRVTRQATYIPPDHKHYFYEGVRETDIASAPGDWATPEIPGAYDAPERPVAKRDAEWFPPEAFETPAFWWLEYEDDDGHDWWSASVRGRKLQGRGHPWTTRGKKWEQRLRLDL